MTIITGGRNGYQIKVVYLIKYEFTVDSCVIIRGIFSQHASSYKSKYLKVLGLRKGVQRTFSQF